MAISIPADSGLPNAGIDLVALGEMVRKKKITETRPKNAARQKKRLGRNIGANADSLKTVTKVKAKGKQPKRPTKAKINASRWLERRMHDRLLVRSPAALRSPRNIVAEKINKNRSNSRYSGALKSLSTDKINTEQLRILKAAARLGPNYMGRTASLTTGFRWTERGKRATNGFTTSAVMMPAADTNDSQSLHDDISSFTQGQLLYMVGHHLIWTDAPSDEFLSYSKDFLFLVIHALGRHDEGQRGVSILLVDRKKAYDPSGQPASFYPALKVGTAVQVWGWNGWSDPQQGALKPRKFTHEFLSHGTILLRDHQFVQAPLESLIERGLFELFPHFDVADGFRRFGLYTSEVACRRAGFPPNDAAKAQGNIYSYGRCAKEWPFDTNLLELVQDLARLFTATAADEDGNVREPHLHPFLGFLTFQKRPRRDSTFIAWMRNHYTATDVIDLYDDGNSGIQPGFVDVASNLPGYMQYLDLIRDAQYAFRLPELPPNVIEKKSEIVDEIYRKTDNREQRNASIAFACDEFGLMRGSRASEAKKKQIASANETETSESEDEDEGFGDPEDFESETAGAAVDDTTTEQDVTEEETSDVDETDDIDAVSEAAS